MQIFSKEFIQFSKKILLFSALLWITNFLLGYVVETLYFSRPFRLTHGIERVEDDIIILGSSRAYHHYIPSMIEDSLGMSCYNLGFDGQNIYFHYALFNSMLARYTPKLVVLDLIPSDFAHTPGRDMETIADLYPYYQRNGGVDEIVRLPDFNWLTLQLSLLKYNSRVYGIMERLLIGNEKQTDHLKGYAPLAGNILPENLRKSVSRNKAEGKAPEYDKTKIEYLSKLISLCESRGIILLAFVSPYWQSDSHDFAIDTLFINHSVPLFDYSDDKHFVLNNYLFKDNTHLNNEGAKLYTDLVIKDMKKYIGDNLTKLQKQ